MITCTTGRYSEQKLPSDLMAVRVNYGRDTTKEVASAFQYCENPKVSEYSPKASFVW